MKELENKLFANELVNTLVNIFANELALQNLETSRRLMELTDSDPIYLQIKHNIEETFEKHKQKYKELTGKDYITQLKLTYNETR